MRALAGAFLLLALGAFAAPPAQAQIPALAGLEVKPVAGETTKLSVSWTAHAGAEKYRVKWKTGSDAFNAGVNATRTDRTITGLAAGTTYTVEVTAVDTDADPDRNVARATASGTTLAAMGTLTLAAVAGSRSEMDVSWADVSDETGGYRVQWKRASAASYSTTGDSYTLASSDASPLTYRIGELSAGRAYDVKVTYRTTIGGTEVDGDCCFADYLITDLPDYFARRGRGFPTVFRDCRKRGEARGVSHGRRRVKALRGSFASLRPPASAGAGSSGDPPPSARRSASMAGSAASGHGPIAPRTVVARA